MTVDVTFNPSGKNYPGMTESENKAYRLGVIDYMFTYIDVLGSEPDAELVAYYDQLHAEQDEIRRYFSEDEVDWRQRCKEADEEMDMLADDSGPTGDDDE